uniref:ATP-binding protein n=1 Tax=Prosthecobacter sp. TaxID=1965333 RepID=UPI00378395D6
MAVILLGGIAIMLCKEQHKRDHYESRLLAARDAALDSVQATSTFVATVSHEIRTPMNGVLGTADLMLRDHTLTPRQREGLDTIRSSGKSLMAIINDILDLSKLQAGEMKLHNESFSLEEVVEDVVALFAASATRKNLELTPHLAPDLPRQLMGDHLRLRQVLGNLVSNAIKFTERGGVTVHVVRRPDMETDGRACLRFEVRDTGPGIAKEDQARLFQPFSQVDVKLAQRHGGTGLGLAISRELVLRMNGALNVESSRGQGATFWFTACFMIVEEAFETPVLESRPILIALENRPMTADAIRDHATAWGLKPMVYGHVADIPRQAPWNAHAMEQPTRAVVIISHTAQDWLEQIRHLRQLEWLKGVPVFLMTDQEDISAEQMAREGLQATLHYPFRPSDLYDHLAGADVAVAKEEVPSRPLQLPRARVIVADDNPVNQRVLANQLEYLGLEVVPCFNGLEAVARVKAGEGVLVLMDCEMPEMDGYEASRKIREWEGANKRPPIPIIAVTAHVMAGALEQCLECGMNSYLTKPMELEKLQQMLLKWLPKQGGQEVEAAASPMTAAAPAASASLEVVNEAQLRSCLKGNSALDQDLVQMAVSQMDKMLAKMRQALEQGLDAEWKRAAHRSRGSSGTLGFTKLAALFQTAEFEATSREARGEVLSQLEQAHDELVARLEEMKIMDTTMPL